MLEVGLCAAQLGSADFQPDRRSSACRTRWASLRTQALSSAESPSFISHSFQIHPFLLLEHTPVPSPEGVLCEADAIPECAGKGYGHDYFGLTLCTTHCTRIVRSGFVPSEQKLTGASWSELGPCTGRKELATGTSLHELPEPDLTSALAAISGLAAQTNVRPWEI